MMKVSAVLQNAATENLMANSTMPSYMIKKGGIIKGRGNPPYLSLTNVKVNETLVITILFWK